MKVDKKKQAEGMKKALRELSKKGDTLRSQISKLEDQEMAVDKKHTETEKKLASLLSPIPYYTPFIYRDSLWQIFDAHMRHQGENMQITYNLQSLGVSGGSSRLKAKEVKAHIKQGTIVRDIESKLHLTGHMTFIKVIPTSKAHVVIGVTKKGALVELSLHNRRHENVLREGVTFKIKTGRIISGGTIKYTLYQKYKDADEMRCCDVTFNRLYQSQQEYVEAHL